jgi:hypothetical protein
MAPTYVLCEESTATEQTASNGDVIIDCAPFQFSPTDVWFTQSIRFYSDQRLARTVMSLENRGTSDIQITGGGSPNIIAFGFTTHARSASSHDGSTCDNLLSNDNWIAMAGENDSTITGVAWQAKGETALDASVRSCTIGNNIYTPPTLQFLTAGTTVNYMSFIATDEPADSTTASMEVAFEAFKEKMASFDSLNDTLCRGLNAEIEGWGTCVQVDAPKELANTGEKTSLQTSIMLTATASIVAGISTLIAVRRRLSAR